MLLETSRHSVTRLGIIVTKYVSEALPKNTLNHSAYVCQTPTQALHTCRVTKCVFAHAQLLFTSCTAFCFLLQCCWRYWGYKQWESMMEGYSMTIPMGTSHMQQKPKSLAVCMLRLSLLWYHYDVIYDYGSMPYHCIYPGLLRHINIQRVFLKSS